MTRWRQLLMLCYRLVPVDRELKLQPPPPSPEQPQFIGQLAQNKMETKIQETDQKNTEPSKAKDDFLQSIPEKFRIQARRFWEKIEGAVTLTESNNVQYSDGSVGSPVQTLILWMITPLSESSEREFDQLKFIRLLDSLNVPSTLFEASKLPLIKILLAPSTIVSAKSPAKQKRRPQAKAPAVSWETLF